MNCKYQNDCRKLEWVLNEAYNLFYDVNISNNKTFYLFNKQIDPNWYNGRNFIISIPEERHELNNLIGQGVYLNNFRINAELKFGRYSGIKEFELNNTQGKNTTYNFYCITNENEKLMKPYRSEPNNNNDTDFNHDGTVLDKFLNEYSPLSNAIQILARNVMRLLKFSKKGICYIYNFGCGFMMNRDYSIKLIWSSIELYLMIITTERFRSEFSPLISYIELYKIKHAPNKYLAINWLDVFFHKYCSTSLFASKNGVRIIHNTDHHYFYSRFLDMFHYVQFINPYDYCSPTINYKFYKRKLEKLLAIRYDQIPKRYSHYNDEYNRDIIRLEETNNVNDQFYINISITPTNSNIY